MGCGASAGGKYEEPKNDLKGASSQSLGDKRGRQRSPQTPDASQKKKIEFNIKDIKETKEIKHHKEHCTDVDLRMAWTLTEAYPFDERDRKDFEKKERVYHATDGRWHDWGTVSVVKMQKDLYCSSCRGFILDRYMENSPFFFCLRCRKDRQDGQHLELCISCYNAGAFQTGPRNSVVNPNEDTGKKKKYAGLHDNLSHLAAAEASTKLGVEHYKMHQKKETESHKLAPLSPDYAAARSPRMFSPREEVNAMSGQRHGALHSGIWKGTYNEGSSKRPVSFNLFFDKNGTVAGHGPDSCRVQGTISGTKISWRETYQWGTISIDAAADETSSKISGKFKASDGGGGTMLLKPSKG